MPSAAAHLGGANYINKKLQLNSDDFMIGALLPDLYKIDKKESHYKIDGSDYLIPDLDYYKKHNDLSDMKNLGYYYHLYLDYYFDEHYLKTITTRKDVFSSGDMYKDYDILSKKVVDYFGLDVDHVNDIFSKYKDDMVDNEKVDLNMRCLSCDKSGDLIILDEKGFIKFIKDTADKFIEDIQK